MPLEPPHVTELRNAEGGPYYLAPDSAEPVPPEIWDGLDDEVVVEQVIETQNHQGDLSATDKQPMFLLPKDRTYLKAGGPAAKKLLETLDRGLEATTPELDEAIEAKLRKAGLQ
jgi:hypothetical protein